MRLHVDAGAVLLLATILCQCGAQAEYPLRLYDLKEHELMDKADMVVVGVTEAIQNGSRSIPIKWDRQYGVVSVRLVSARISVEEVIRGQVTGGSVVVRYWAADQFTNAHSLSLPELSVGRRAIHYIVNAHEGLRYVADIVSSTTPVYSGAHKPAAPSGSTDEKTRLAQILLTPGEGNNNERFLANLGTSTSDALLLAGFERTLPLLRALAENSNISLRWSACVQMYRSAFFGQADCLDHIADRGLDAKQSSDLRELLVERARSQLRFKTAFLLDPIRTADEYAVLPSPEGVWDFLNLITKHPDQQLAERARTALGARVQGGGPENTGRKVGRDGK
jgi:hypothetical protein